jgi:hypothetical protein
MRALLSTGLILIMTLSCREDAAQPGSLRFFEIGFRSAPSDWRDASFVVATSNADLLSEIEAELAKPEAERRHVNGLLAAGDAGYNRNQAHVFKWHLDPEGWSLAELSIELCDGRPYSDVDLEFDYWLNTVKRFCPWGSFIKKEVAMQLN